MSGGADGAALPKYARPEIERRWRVALSELSALDALPYREIEDLYLAGTQLRLRKVSTPDVAEAQFKLGKKYGRSAGVTEPVASLYLSAPEYARLAQLPGWRVHKRRHALAGGALDVYRGSDCAIFEMEFDSPADATAYAPPGFVGEEVSCDPACSGAALAQRLGQAQGLVDVASG